MFEQFTDLTAKQWLYKLQEIFLYISKRWLLLLLAVIVSSAIGYFTKPPVKKNYTATFSFVLSTETKSSGLSGIASQFGLEVGTGGSENIFSGDNIIELFKSRKMITYALLNNVENQKENLLTYMTRKFYPTQVNTLLPYPSDISKFTTGQTGVLNASISRVASSFNVAKKDKKLIFYLINATSEYDDIAYLVAKNMLDQTSRFFIETKTKVATRSLSLLLNEADSLGDLLGVTFRSTASMNDRSFNINPSMLTQRSGMQFNQAKATALGAAYTEVMRNLEIAKINIQKETPLFQVIDEPVLPLKIQISEPSGYIKYAIIIGILTMIIFIVLGYLWKTEFSKK